MFNTASNFTGSLVQYNGLTLLPGSLPLFLNLSALFMTNEYVTTTTVPSISDLSANLSVIVYDVSQSYAVNQTLAFQTDAVVGELWVNITVPFNSGPYQVNVTYNDGFSVVVLASYNFSVYYPSPPPPSPPPPHFDTASLFSGSLVESSGQSVMPMVLPLYLNLTARFLTGDQVNASTSPSITDLESNLTATVYNASNAVYQTLIFLTDSTKGELWINITAPANSGPYFINVTYDSGDSVVVLASYNFSVSSYPSPPPPPPPPQFNPASLFSGSLVTSNGATVAPMVLPLYLNLSATFLTGDQVNLTSSPSIISLESNLTATVYDAALAVYQTLTFLTDSVSGELWVNVSAPASSGPYQVNVTYNNGSSSVALASYSFSVSSYPSPPPPPPPPPQFDISSPLSGSLVDAAAAVTSVASSSLPLFLYLNATFLTGDKVNTTSVPTISSLIGNLTVVVYDLSDSSVAALVNQTLTFQTDGLEGQLWINVTVPASSGPYQVNVTYANGTASVLLGSYLFSVGSRRRQLFSAPSAAPVARRRRLSQLPVVSAQLGFTVGDTSTEVEPGVCLFRCGGMGGAVRFLMMLYALRTFDRINFRARSFLSCLFPFNHAPPLRWRVILPQVHGLVRGESGQLLDCRDPVRRDGAREHAWPLHGLPQGRHHGGGQRRGAGR